MPINSRSIGQKRSRSPPLNTGSIALTRATNPSRTSSDIRQESLPTISRFAPAARGPLRFRNLFARVQERLLHDGRMSPPVRVLDRELRTHVRVDNREHCVTDVRPEAGRVNRGCDPANRSSPGRHGPLRHVEPDRLAVDLDPDEFPFRAFVLDSLQSCFADEVAWLVEVHGPAESDLVRIVLDHHVRAVVPDARLDPANVGRARGPQIVLFPGFDDGIPELTATRSIEEVQFVADLPRPTRAGDEERDSVQIGPREEIIWEGRDLLPEEVRHQLLGLRPLHLE